MVAPTSEFVDALYREKVIEARNLPVDAKLRLGAELFDYACEITKAGIRMQHPDESESGILDLLRERLELAERLERGT